MNIEHRTSNIQRPIKDVGPETEAADTGDAGKKSDEHFMRQALSLAENALAAGEFPVGCVIVFENQVVARGSRVSSSGAGINEIDHAEIMALREFYGVAPGRDPKRITVYATLEPCLMCFAALVIAGVGKIVYAYEDAMGGGTHCRLVDLSPFYRDRRPLVVPHILRDESLGLFKAFFKNPETDYLQGSHLAAYTLGQQIGGSTPPARTARV